MADLFCQVLPFFFVYVAADLILNRLTRGARFFFRSLVMWVVFALAVVVHSIEFKTQAPAEILVMELFFYFLWAFYTIFLVNVTNSFSLGLLQVVRSVPGKKISVNDLEAHFDLSGSLEKRIESLQQGGLIQRDPQGRLWMTSKGQVLSRGTLILRRLLRITDVG